MTVEEAREKLCGVVGAADEWLVDAYGDARELKGHVEACRRRKIVGRTDSLSPNCGDGWYCDQAPIKETQHDG